MMITTDIILIFDYNYNIRPKIITFLLVISNLQVDNKNKVLILQCLLYKVRCLLRGNDTNGWDNRSFSK